MSHNTIKVKEKEIESFLNEYFNGALKVWKKKQYDYYSTWWVSFKENSRYKGKLFMAMSFDISSNEVRVNFRFEKSIRQRESGLVKWHPSNGTYYYVPFEINKDKLPNAIKNYLRNLQESVNDGTIRRFTNFDKYLLSE
ncbi:MAG: hypothetical protein ACE14S_10505 [Candidatus Bathyarchaeia archaeon]